MKAVIFPAAQTISIETVPDPTCSDEDVVVKVAHSGICGTDIHIYRAEYMSDFPLIPGHEFGGEVVEVGKNVTDITIGDRVVADPNIYCNHCDFCRNEQANHCSNLSVVGVTRNGGFAEYVDVPGKSVYKIPASFTNTQAAFVEPLACVVWALKRMRVNPADRILIFGSGPMGLLLLQTLKHGGASQITMVDKQTSRLDMAKQFGATQVLMADADLDGRLKTSAPHGYDIVIDATGVPAVIETSFQYLKVRGQFLQFGVTPIDARISISPYDIFHKDWQIIGSFALCYTFLPAIELLNSGVVDVSPLVSHRLPLADFEAGFKRFMAGETLKVHIEIGA